jgi:hypothetical protein
MIELGSRVTAPKPLRRRKGATRREWTITSWKIKKPITGIYIGWRTYANGRVEGGINWDDPVYFVPDKFIKVALIVTDERSNPVPVPYETMEEL